MLGLGQAGRLLKQLKEYSGDVERRLRDRKVSLSDRCLHSRAAQVRQGSDDF